MTGKLPKLGTAWRRVIDEESERWLKTRPFLWLIYRLGCEARKVMSPQDVIIEVPAAQLTLEGHAPTVEVSPKTHEIGLEATAKGVANLGVRHAKAIGSHKNIRRILWGLLITSIPLILIPVGLTVFLSLPKEIEAILDMFSNFGYAVFAVFLAAWLSRAWAALDS